MRSVIASLSLFLFAAVAGCGESHVPGMPSAMVGSYLIDVEANGVTDKSITMTVSLSSGSGVLLDFAAGISQVRCSVTGATELSLPRQKVDVAHATGEAVGDATGEGTIDSTGAVDLTIHLATAGITGSDGGVGSDVDYHVTGAKN